MHGVLDLVGAGVGVALVPASTVLLGTAGVTLKPLRRPGAAEKLALLRRHVDEHPLLAPAQTVVSAIFVALTQRVNRLIGA